MPKVQRRTDCRGRPLSTYHRRYAKGARCAVEDCGARRAKREYCHKHYSRWKRWGDPLVTGRAPSTPGMSASARAAWIRQYKLERGCADCGYATHPAALEFDHLPGKGKSTDIRHGQSLGWLRLLVEIEKCDVVCANCHAIRTAERRGHGRAGAKLEHALVR